MLVYCVRTEPIDGEVVCRNINLKSEVLFMGVTPKSLMPGKKMKLKPGIPLFTTADGDWLQLDSLERYTAALEPHSFDLLDSSTLVNIDLIDFIEQDKYGYVVRFRGSDKSIPISKSKAKEYEHLIRKKGLDPIIGY